jgi:UDP-3-O-[3-hydroxymyristoyl] glucosamine N-acyltransferase
MSCGAAGAGVRECVSSPADTDEPGSTWSGMIPAQPIKEWQRNLARLRRLEDLVSRVKNLEHKLENETKND